jgi:nickel-type superoxide dismutase maturation protease
MLIAAGVGAAYCVGKRYRRFEISGRSMLPGLHPGDWVLVDEWAYRSTPPVRGHVVVVTHPRELSRHLVKRVAYVDGSDELRVEGDNLAESTDSREFGPVSASLVVGRVRWRYWPLSRAGTVI